MMKFTVGDKVFAKVRGYPPWPATVEAITVVTPNKVKYDVVFYGTLETATLKSENLYPYAENKETFGKPSKRKYFNEGLAQIEGLVSMPALSRTNCAESDKIDSDAEETLIVDEKLSVMYYKPMKPKSYTTGDYGDEKLAAYVPAERDAKRERWSSPQKHTKKNRTSSEEKLKSNEVSSTAKQEIVSRSGRKIKPKRFADEETFYYSSVLTASGYQQQNAEETIEANSTGKIAEKSELMIKVKERRRRQLEFWKKEVEMLTLEGRIKVEFNIDKANPEQGLAVLEEFHHIGIEPLMLKKNPHVVETIEKLARYTGNTVGLKYSKEQKILFAAICEKVKRKAKLIIDEFAMMFNVPEGSNFHDVFCANVAELNNKTQYWDQNKVYALVEDPTVEEKKLGDKMETV